MYSKLIYVGTFHKSDTVLLSLILAGLHKKGFVKLWRSDWVKDEPQTWDVNFHYHSEFMFGESLYRIPENARNVISVRDPRDLLVSATRYHCDSKESWLHTPRDSFEGMTYQERINAQSSWEEKLLFEMRHSSGHMIKRMEQVPYDDQRVMRVKLEDLMVDTTLDVFDRVFRHIGFKGLCLNAALEYAKELSLFSKPESRHSRGGYPGEWRDKMSDSVQRAFNVRFPNAPGRLGYEID